MSSSRSETEGADTDGSLQLPEVVRKAWGLTSPGRRGPRAELSLQRVVATAIRLADAQGLGQVSMARIADELGFTTMSLYRHLRSKEELLVHLQDAVLGVPPRQSTDGALWRDGLAAWTRELFEIYTRHGWVLDIPISGPPVMPHNLQWMDWAFAIMESIPLRSGEKLSILLLLSGYARNEATLAQSLRGRSDKSNGEDQDYERSLRLLVTADHLPALHRAIADTGLFDAAPETDSGTFDFGLARILDGIEVMVDRLS